MNTILTTTQLQIGHRLSRRHIHTVASHLNLTLRAGELVCLIGPNGVGKSTLLQSLAGILPPINGEVLINQQPVNQISLDERAKMVSVVLTEKPNVGTLSVYTVISLGRHPYTDWQGRFSEEDDAAVEAAIRHLDIEDLRDKNLNELSDGEQQKVMIARALAQSPALMLLDEPTAFLDLPHKIGLMQLFQKFAHQLNKAVLVSTHDLDLALKYADVLWLMSKGQPVEVGAPEDLVINQSIHRVFSAQGISFDAMSGRFESEQKALTTIHLTGVGVPRVWTEKALLRAGYLVVGEDLQTAMDVIISWQDGAINWRLVLGEEKHIFTDVYELVRFLQGYVK